ncbi:hypothetical protein [Chryseobacterium potabilaquae]|uniref:Uncharacterized protein n=1 Tax=Chryseobacterium potabilaquae TaxID=2675057 RepID=A0A6N4XA25_9FLAO|nr:hypothetical protein [Chryseobacterium potabilaquae]CAA7195873.1 hypothetical protein CHRY9293_02030 [Chryseobacterium potabilaquae]
MRNRNTAPQKRQVQDKHFQAQKSRVFKAFSERPKTMLMVSVETRICRANICRYVSQWQRENRIEIVRKGFCSLSKHRAGFYSTNSEFLFNLKSNTK